MSHSQPEYRPRNILPSTFSNERSKERNSPRIPSIRDEFQIPLLARTQHPKKAIAPAEWHPSAPARAE